jgi:hypothetical protein
MTARIHWARIALTAAMTLITGAAHAQESVHPMTRVMTEEEFKNRIHPVNPADPEAGLPLYKRTMMPPPAAPSGPIIFHAVIRPNDPQPATVTPVVMNGGMGGLISAHQLRFAAIRHSGAPVEMRGGCWSACTMITGYVAKERLCFAPGAFLAFHAARTAEPPYGISHSGTWAMYATQPLDIQQWIDAHGGVNKLTMETFWFMSDRDLWSLGYPRCK